MIKVSVIVPNYNHAPYLRQRIDSILNQTYQAWDSKQVRKSIAYKLGSVLLFPLKWLKSKVKNQKSL